MSSSTSNAHRAHSDEWGQTPAHIDALYDRHTWACWDTARAIVRFNINGALQGSDLAVKPGTRLHARIQLSCEAPLESLEVVTLEDVATPVRFEPEALDLDVTVALPAAVVSTWYYLRARQTDGALIYASPVFIDIAGD